MSTFKCKMCGGTLEIEPNETIATCEYCGTQQTLPKLDDERRANLYDRANHFRRNNEFDKAMGIYEKILNEDNTDAEAYWSLVLCRYGIEYVEDPASHKRVPTVNRAQFTSIYDDDNYKSALQYADSLQRSIYEAEAATINEIQKGILEISSKEEPFDVFICYKESDASGRRTPDSVLATELYHELTNEGFKVFFSRITLEDKLGTAYEPYIFAALNSAKVMVVLGTKPEYFNAVWVKNEWSRYLALIKAGQKKILIPAYKDMDPYDLPEEFSHLQAQDMTKLGFMQDLIRGIKKILYVDDPKPAVAKETVTTETATVNTAPLLKRAFMFLEDGNWRDADAYCEKVLDQDPENAEAYLGKLMAELHVRKRAELQTYNRTFTYSLNYQKIVRFGNKEMIAELDEANRRITEWKKKLQLTKAYDEAVASMDEASKSKDENAYKAAAEKFREISDFKDSKVKMETCLEKAEICRKECLYRNALDSMGKNTKSGYEQAIRIFTELGDWENSRENIVVCQNGIDEINKKDAEACENARIAAEQREIQRKHEAELHEIQEKKRKKVVTIVSVVVACAALIFFGSSALIKNSQYNKAHALMDSGDYNGAIEAFETLDNYKDSTDLINDCRYQAALSYMSAENYDAAITEFEELENNIQDTDLRNECEYQKALALTAEGKYDAARKIYKILGDYKDSAEKITEVGYQSALAMMDAGQYENAISAFKALNGYKDSASKIEECTNIPKAAKYNKAVDDLNSGNYVDAYETFMSISDYKDSKEKASEIYEQYKSALLKEATVGSIITFGSYEQDGNTKNGADEIEWIVLEEKDNKLLVISRKILDVAPFNSKWVDSITWEKSTLRKWLNSDFYNSAFTASEKSHIQTVTVTAEKNPKYNTPAGSNTQDKIFLLSISEAETYFGKNGPCGDGSCEMTDWARYKLSYLDHVSKSWWLRTPGQNNQEIAYYIDNTAVASGSDFDFSTTGVRPAMWISLNS